MLTQVWKTTGRKPKELEAVPDFPSSLLYVWQWFLELSVPGEILKYTEIEAYNRLLSKGMTPQEVVLLKRLDSLR